MIDIKVQASNVNACSSKLMKQESLNLNLKHPTLKYNNILLRQIIVESYEVVCSHAPNEQSQELGQELFLVEKPHQDQPEVGSYQWIRDSNPEEIAPTSQEVFPSNCQPIKIRPNLNINCI